MLLSNMFRKQTKGRSPRRQCLFNRAGDKKTKPKKTIIWHVRRSSTFETQANCRDLYVRLNWSILESTMWGARFKSIAEVRCWTQLIIIFISSFYSCTLPHVFIWTESKEKSADSSLVFPSWRCLKKTKTKNISRKWHRLTEQRCCL